MTDAAALARLAGKYEALAALRRARARGEPVPPAHVFKALAREFPGCLNELDMLPMDEIEARRADLARAAAGSAVAPWMIWLADFHALWRAALSIKARSRRARALDDAGAMELAREAGERAGIAVDADFARAVAAPPAGRLNAVVFARLALAHGTPAEAIKRALFPYARR